MIFQKKQLLFWSLLMLCFNFLSAQDFSALKGVELKAEDCKLAEAKVLECCNYVLGTPVDKANANRTVATQYVVKWMTATPDYSFLLDKDVMAMAKENKDMLPVYMAAMSKSVLSSTTGKKSNEEISADAVRYLLDYCEVKENGIKAPKALKKMDK